jgi:RHS repeat-associated protein
MELASNAFSTGVPASAAIPQLAGNSRQGFGLQASTSCLGSGFSISSNTLGLSTSLYDGDAGSRSTGKERDAESGNDYFEARYFGSSMGRFLSPDPSQLYFADPTNPQSFNLYSYVLNNPLVNVDPDGLDCLYAQDSGGVRIQTGDCTNAGGKDDDGVYVNGTVNSATQDDQGNVTSYSTDSGSFLADGTPNNSSVQVTAQDPGVVGALPLEPPQQIQEVDPSLQLALGVMNFGIPKLCAAGITASFRKFNAGVSASGNGVGATANGHSSSHYTPQAKGVDMRSASRAFKSIPFGVNLAPSDPSGNSINSVSADGTVKKVGVTAYVNIGTYTPNINDPKNCK